MIAGIFHPGSGLGNQLHRYVMARSLSIDKDTDFGMVNPANFKGSSFMDLYMGRPVDWLDDDHYEFYEQKVVNAEGNDVRGYDDRLWTIISTPYMHILIDGEFQGEKYYEHHLDKIREWLAVEPLGLPDDLCVIGFRGGEYVGVRDLFLPRFYWTEAMAKMSQQYPGIKFHVVTDDIETAKDMFAGLDLTISHDVGHDWRMIRYAKHLIIANSSFYILPSLLGDAKEIIAPEFWAGYNKGYWQLEQNQYKRFTYI